MRTNCSPRPVNTNWGDKVGIWKLRPRAEQVNANWAPGLVNTNWGTESGAIQKAEG